MTLHKLPLVLVFFLPMLSSCINKHLVPSRDAHAIFYTDGTCKYSFDGLAYGEKEDHSLHGVGIYDWRGLVCKHKKANPGFTWSEDRAGLNPEIWPGVAVYMGFAHPRRWKGLERSLMSPPNEISFRLYNKKYKDEDKYPNQIHEGLNFWAVFAFSGNDAENYVASGIKKWEVRSQICGIRFYSSNHPANFAIIYSEEQQAESGIVMEVRTKIKAQADGC